MIKHVIVKYKPTVQYFPQQQQMGQIPGRNTPNLPVVVDISSNRACVFGKQAYANFLNSIPFKKGDYVTIKAHALFPTNADDVWKVKDIQEIHYLCEGNDTSHGPVRPLQVVNRLGFEKWVAASELCKNYLDRYNF